MLKWIVTVNVVTWLRTGPKAELRGRVGTLFRGTRDDLGYNLVPQNCYTYNTVMVLHSPSCRPGSSVGIGTGYGLHGPGIESRWEARFSAPVQTGPGAHTASCTMATGSFPGVKSGRGVTLTPHPLPLLWSRIEYSYTSTPRMGRTACTEPQCLYKGAHYHFTVPPGGQDSVHGRPGGGKIP